MTPATANGHPAADLVTRADLYRHTLLHFFAPVADKLFHDDAVSEVLINGPDEIYFERAGRLEPMTRDGKPVRFPSAAALRAAVNNVAEFVDRVVDDDRPAMDARLPDPYRFRVHVIGPPCARAGLVVSIRKFSKSKFTVARLLEATTERPASLTAESAAYLRLMVQTHRNLVVSGGTGSGKTSMLNALSEFVPDHERVVVIEDSSELNMQKPHVVYLEARPPRPDGTGAMTIRDLFVNSLRMRPDRIVVGEVRRGEALDLIQSMLSGHDGAMSTVHASSPTLALVRLETLCLMSETQLPVYVARTQVAAAIHVVVQVARLPDGSRRVTHVSEVADRLPGEGGGYVTKDIFRFRGRRTTGGTFDGDLLPTGEVSRFAEELREMGYGDEMAAAGRAFAGG